MDDKYFLVDTVADWQVAEQLREQFIDFEVVLVLDLAFESVHLVELLGFVVATAHEEMLRKGHFPCKHLHDDFDGERASINEIAIEKVRVLS